MFLILNENILITRLEITDCDCDKSNIATTTKIICDYGVAVHRTINLYNWKKKYDDIVSHTIINDYKIYI